MSDIDLLEEFGILNDSRNARKAAREIPEQLARAGELLAEARSELAKAQSEQAAWLATELCDAAVRNPKAAQWRVQTRIEASPQWLAHQKQVAVATEAAAKLENVVETLRLKAQFALVGLPD